MTDYVIKIGAQFYSPFCRQSRSSEYPDTIIFTKIHRATAAARQLATMYPTEEIQVWKDYGLAKESVVMTFNGSSDAGGTERSNIDKPAAT